MTAPSRGTRAPAWLDDAVDAGAEVVTASRRLARELRRVHDARQLAIGLKSWRTPRIVSWDAWLNGFIDASAATVAWPRRLHPQASAILWERCLARAAEARLLDHDGLVRQARQGWQRINEWCVPLDDLARHAGNEDEKLFAAAAGAYRRLLSARDWIDAALLPELVAERLQQHEIEAPGRLVLAGFDRLTPAQRALVDALETRGCSVSMAPAPAHRRAPRVVSCADADAELRSAGAWARARLASDHDARIAIVFPGLEQQAARAERLVREGLAPGWQQVGRAHDAAV